MIAMIYARKVDRSGEETKAMNMKVKLPGNLVETLHPDFQRTILRFFRERCPDVLNEYRKWKREQRQTRKTKKRTLRRS